MADTLTITDNRTGSLDPQRCPVHVMQLRARLRRENDFDYFL